MGKMTTIFHRAGWVLLMVSGISFSQGTASPSEAVNDNKKMPTKGESAASTGETGSKVSSSSLVTIDVKNPSKEPITTAKVDIVPMTQSNGQKESVLSVDANGHAEITLSAGEYLLTISDTQEKYLPQTEILEINGNPLNVSRRLIEKSGGNVNTLKSFNVSSSRLKSSQREQEFQGSLAILDDRKLTELAVKEPSDLSQITTGIMNVSTGGGSGLGVSIHGISPMRPEPVIGYYIDGVPQLEPQGNPTSFFLIEEMTLYKSIQPTLFGQTFLGGVIEILTHKPKNKVEGQIKMSVGNGIYQGYGIYASVPIIQDKFFILGNLDFTKLDGFVRNVNLNKKAGGYQNMDAGISLQGFIGKVSAILSYNYANNDSSPLALGINTEMLGEKNRVIHHSIENKATTSSHTTTLNVAYNITPSVIMRNIISHRYYTYDHHLDYDFIEEDFLQSFQKRNNQTLIEELTFSSPRNIPLKWKTGAYLSYASRKYDEKLLKTQEAADRYTLKEGYEDFNYTHQEIHLAPYGEVSYTFPFGFGMLYGMKYDFYHKNLKLTTYDRELDQSLRSKKTYPEQTHDFHGYSVKTGLFYLYQKNLNLYANFVRGYRPGGINEIITNEKDFNYGPEITYNYDMGLKFNLLNGIILFDLSYFLIDWRHIQLFAFTKPRVFELVVQNGGRARSHGPDANITFVLYKNVFLETGYVYTYGRFIDGHIALVDHFTQRHETVALKDKKLPFTPDHFVKVAFQGGYEIHSKHYPFTLFGRLEYFYNSGIYYSEKNIKRSPNFHNLNFKMGLTSEKLDVVLSFKNILSQIYQTYSLELTGDFYADRVAVNDPFRFTLDATYKF